MTRTRTPDFCLPPDHASRAVFERGVYADPPKVRVGLLDVGRALFTSAHTRQINALRDECARLHSYTDHLKARSYEAMAVTRRTERCLAEVGADVMVADAKIRTLVNANAALKEDVRLAADALSEVDSMFLNIQSRRLSRMGETAHLMPPRMAGGQEAPMAALGAPESRSC